MPMLFANASFLYDGDGKRVQSEITTNLATTTTYFVGNYYEVTGSSITKYYYAGAQRIAMSKDGTLNFMLGDHLGSTSLVTDATGVVVSEIKYKAWGEVRYASGTPLTKYTYTGQYSDSYINLLWYGSRHYDPALGRFIQPDSIVPLASQGVQAWDRYAYVNNAPTRYTDPTGHKACINLGTDGKCQDTREEQKLDKLLCYVYGKILNRRGQVKDKYEALEAMNLIVGKAALIYGKDWDGFFKATNLVFLGTHHNSPYTMAVAHSNPSDFRGITFGGDNGDTGFEPDFRQGGENQVRHFWAGFATAANGHRGEVNAQYGNFYHDLLEDWAGRPDTVYSDYVLTITAVDIGHEVNSGSIASPADLPGAFDATLGINSPGYTGFNWQWLFNTPDM